MQTTAVILAGGRGSRMGGADKGLVLHAGKPLITHVLQRIAPQVDALRINANRNLEQYRAFGYPILTDENDRFDGPLAGMQCALRALNTTWLLCVPCDNPLLPLNLVTSLTHAAMSAQASIAIARSASGVHPVTCLLHQSLLASLDDYLQRGQRKVSTWQMQHPHVMVDFEDDLAFTNLNHLPTTD